MNPAWLFGHIRDALRVKIERPRSDIYCSEQTAVLLGVAGLVFLLVLVVHGFWELSK